jgi:hypothetical protein
MRDLLRHLTLPTANNPNQRKLNLVLNGAPSELLGALDRSYAQRSDRCLA